MKKLLTILCALGFLAIAGSVEAATIKYLDKAAVGTADGSSWTNAWTTFDAALQGSVTPAASAEVIVYVRDGVYNENSSSGGALYLRQNFTNLVTFRHDPADSTPNVIIEPARTGASSSETGHRVLSTTANLTFEDVTFRNSIKVLSSADSLTNYATSTDATISLNTTTFYEGTGAINLTKVGTSTVYASTSVPFTAIYHDAGGNPSISLYVKDATALAKLATTGSILLRVGSDGANYQQSSINKSVLAVGWNHLWGYPRTTTVGSPVTASTDYVEIVLVAASAATVWSEGDFIFDDVNSNASGALNLNYSTTGVNITNLTFRRVTFDTGYASNYGAVKYSPNNTTGTNVVNGLYFYDCIFNNRTKNTASGTLNGLYIKAMKESNYVYNLVIRNTTFNGGVYAMMIDGAVDFKIQFVKVLGALTYAFNIPTTGATQATLGANTYGVIEDSYFETINTNGGNATHGAVIGTNLNNGNQVIFRRNYMVSPAVNGLVLKGTFNAVVESNIFETLASGGVALFFKGCTTCIARNNYIIARGGGIGGSDDGANWKNTNATFYNNYVQAIGASGTIFQFADQATQLGGNYVNYNAFDVASSTAASKYGTIGTDSSLASVAEVRTAWATYSAAYSGNDANSFTATSTEQHFTSPDGRYARIPQAGGLVDIGAGLASVVTSNSTDYYGRPLKLFLSGTPKVPIGPVNRVLAGQESYIGSLGGSSGTPRSPANRSQTRY
jgi:hypothetical protein